MLLKGRVALVTGGSSGVGAATAKSAMLGFSRNLVAELGPEQITVNMIAGGLTMP